MSETVKVVPSMESETKGEKKTDLLEMISKAPQPPETFLDEEKEAEKSVPSPANQLVGIWEGTVKPLDSRQKSWTWSECHLRVLSLASPLPISRSGDEKLSQPDPVANIRIKGSGLCKMDGEEKSERFMVFGIMDSASGYLELYCTINKAELPVTMVFLGRAQFDTLEIHAVSSESRLVLTRQSAKESSASSASTSTTVSKIPEQRGRRGRRNSETLTTSDLLGTRTPLIEALLYEAPVFTGPFTHFLRTPVAASGLMSGTTEGGDTHIAPLSDITPLSGIWEGHCSTFALKETVALFDVNLFFKFENQLGVILGKGGVLGQNGTYPIIFRGSFSPFLQFGFVWAHLSATTHPVGEPVRSFQFLAKLDITGKAIEAHDHNTAVYLSYQGPSMTSLSEQDFIPLAQPVPESSSTGSPMSTATSLGQPMHPLPPGTTVSSFYPPQPLPPMPPRRTSGPLPTGDTSIDPLINSFSHLQMMGSSFPQPQPIPQMPPQPMFHEPPSAFPPSLPLMDPSHPPTGPGIPPQPPAQPPFHPAPPQPEKAPRTNPHHVLQTLRERPPSPMSIIPEATPDLPQAPHINKAFVTKEGTLKSPLVNPEEDSNRQPRRLSAARAALTVSMYTMPRWLTLPLYLRCLVSTNSTHPYPYTHPSQLHPPTRRRKDSTASSSAPDSRGSSRRGSTTSTGSTGRSEKNARRRRNRKSRPSSPQRPQPYPATFA